MADSAASTVARGGARWVSLRRACEILGVDESTLRRWADTGRLRVYRTPGGHRRFSLGNLEEMVAGEGRHRGSDEVERIAMPRIRRQLQRARQQEHGWYASLSDANRVRLRDLGRRLLEMAGEYLDKRTRRSGLLDEALEIGGAYGGVLIDAGLPLAGAVGAYIGFRKTMDETTRQTAERESLPMEEALEAIGQVHALGDQVLLGMASAYEAAALNADS
ncbi:MAG TPA: helix-turn-helix domain-containing protein [Dehalococcoidia bacterium]|nr:helix-turn-helix domain-containing protein [Dehalococcoidia bacterium]